MAYSRALEVFNEFVGLAADASALPDVVREEQSIQPVLHDEVPADDAALQAHVHARRELASLPFVVYLRSLNCNTMSRR